jgi:hypothetical protein
MLSVLGAESGFVDNVVNHPIQLRNPIDAIRILWHLMALRSATLIYMLSDPTRGIIKRDSFLSACGFRQILCVPTNEDLCLSRILINKQEVEPGHPAWSVVFLP